MRQKLLDAGAELVFEDMQELPALIEAVLADRAA
jgi:hypothetical protein